MARNTYASHLRGEDVSLKKYLYALRPLLAIRRLEQRSGVVPTEFASLVEACVADDELRRAIDDLVRVKAASAERERTSHVPVLLRFIERELESRDAKGFDLAADTPDVALFDAVFQDTLKRLYG